MKSSGRHRKHYDIVSIIDKTPVVALSSVNLQLFVTSPLLRYGFHMARTFMHRLVVRCSLTLILAFYSSFYHFIHLLIGMLGALVFIYGLRRHINCLTKLLLLFFFFSFFLFFLPSVVKIPRVKSKEEN